MEPVHANLVTTDAGSPLRVTVVDERFDPAGAVVTVDGELDIVTAPVLRERLNSLAETGVRRLVIDLRAVPFMDSVAVAVLVRAKHQLGEDARISVVIEDDSYTRMIFEVAGLPHWLDLVATREDGIARVTSAD
jgi:anti-sigma B factor antagonist